MLLRQLGISLLGLAVEGVVRRPGTMAPATLEAVVWFIARYIGGTVRVRATAARAAYSGAAGVDRVTYPLAGWAAKNRKQVRLGKVNELADGNLLRKRARDLNP